MKLPRHRVLARLVACGLAFAQACPLAAAAAGTEPLEYRVKAVYLYKFGDFIEWPAAEFAAPTSAVNLCVAGADPFGAGLDAAIAGQHIGARPIVVRRLQEVTHESGCQILFVGGSDAAAIGKILDTVRGTGVLTVTDSAGAGPTPSIIRFVIQGEHVRFVIDGYAATLNGITISSKLLSLALPGNGTSP